MASDLYEIDVSLEIDGEPVNGFPVSLVLSPEIVMDIDQRDTNTVTAAQLGGNLDTLHAAVVLVDKASTVRMQGQASGGIPLVAGGLVVVGGARITTVGLLSVLAGVNPTQIRAVLFGERTAS